MRVLGIEGTAWAASAAVYDTGDEIPDEAGGADGNGGPDAVDGPTGNSGADGIGVIDSNDGFARPGGTDWSRLPDETILVESEYYEPDSGGIHPREAAEHMREAIPTVVERALEHAVTAHLESGGDPEDAPIDAVAFSRGPGLGPCLRIVATAARALAGRLAVPLVGVNHMIAHLEIGRHTSGFDDPICLNASGANAHLLAYRDGRYRVIGETMDTGVGNAIDKFTRHVGWSHPGGPKVEAAAADGEYVDLPYVVKGMDFSFSGIMSAAKAAVDDGTPVEDVCFGLQETIFAMLTEVSERALSLTDSDELVLGGGVGQNARLREMLETMCADRGASFHAPEARFLRDNAGMIAVLGAKMYAAGATLAVEDSRVDPDFRPDDVSVAWRPVLSRRSGEQRGVPTGHESSGHEPSRHPPSEGDELAAPSGRAGRRDESHTIQGAEAVVVLDPAAGVVRKTRRSKPYRHPNLDERLRRERTTLEARLTSQARRVGVPTPVVRDVDVANATIEFEYVGEAELGERLAPESVSALGEHLARIHRAGFVHGDPTVRNVRVGADRTYLVDFGLGFHTDHVEDHAMDLHVFQRSLAGTAADAESLSSTAEAGYASAGDDAVIERLREIEGRGRYR